MPCRPQVSDSRPPHNFFPSLAIHPATFPTVNQMVTFATNAYGHASARVGDLFNVTLDTPKMEVSATEVFLGLEKVARWLCGLWCPLEQFDHASE
jgi:hypothetical protein